jgi:chaperonin GroEL
MKKNIEFGYEARLKLIKGINKIADSVGITLGPKGRNVIIEKNDGLKILITKDGVTVAKEIELEDSLENIGCQIIKEAATKTSDDAGDGTTTATILARTIVEKGLKTTTTGVNPIDLKRGIDKAVKKVVEKLNDISIPIGEDFEKIRQVATISANNDKDIGDKITEAMKNVGLTGIITIEDASGIDTTLENVKGMKLDRGYISPYFVTDPDKMEVILEKPLILIHEEKIASVTNLIPILELYVKTGRPMLIIADTLENDVLGTLVMNKMKGILKIAAIKGPEFGDRRKNLLDDIAVLTGGNLISDVTGKKLETTTLDDLGSAEKIIINNNSTIIIGGKGDSDLIKNRINQIKNQIETSKNDYDKQKNETRLANLTGGICQINVGASSEIELKEKKDRFDDALHATKAAIEEGIVPGGGVAYIRCINCLDDLELSNEDEKIGVDIIRKSLEEPLRKIVENSGKEPSIILNNVINSLPDVGRSGKIETLDFGYDAHKEVYGNLFELGIIDPKKVSRVALENAASVAGLFLTTECVISEIKNKKEEKIPL